MLRYAIFGYCRKRKNGLFRVAVDYLFREKKVGSQKELAEKIGITEPSLSRVMNGGRIVSDKTLHKMNEAFGCIFNMAYFRGEDPHCMLMEDLAYYKQHPEERLVFDKPQEVLTELENMSLLTLPANSPRNLFTVFVPLHISFCSSSVGTYLAGIVYLKEFIFYAIIKTTVALFCESISISEIGKSNCFPNSVRRWRFRPFSQTAHRF